MTPAQAYIQAQLGATRSIENMPAFVLRADFRGIKFPCGHLMACTIALPGEKLREALDRIGACPICARMGAHE